MRNVILTGFMGTGKTTVGKILEKRMNMRFVDTDKVIEERAGMTIPEIFSKMGEGHFRKLESEAIKMTTADTDQIIATGGGAVVDEDNLRILKSSGKVISLFASTDTIIERVADNNERPLLEGGKLREEIERLMSVRMEYYNKADIKIDTDGKTPLEVADKIKNLMAGSDDNVHVCLDDRSYDIKIGQGNLKDIGNELKSLGYSEKTVLISNNAIFDMYGKMVTKRLADSGFQVEVILVKDGEASKSLDVVNEVITGLLERRSERETPLIALGGGVIGDLTGFVASIYLRGVPFVQIPTTLLAQVDSSVGGKTGVNHKLGKNLIGAFYQPKLVLIDTDVLKTLPEEEFLNGIAEIIKYGVIKDAELFGYLRDNRKSIMLKDVEPLKHIIKRSCEIKADVVSADEREAGLRAILNFGHTLGHALEATSSYKGIKHGKAVAIGMVFAAKLAVKKGLCNDSVVDEVTHIINDYGIDTRIAIKDTRTIINTMRLDKKVKKGDIKFVLPENIGEIDYGISVTEEEIESVLSGR